MPAKRVRIGISSCLLGDEVRFDGGHKRNSFLTDTLGPNAEWVRVCPEVELGLGVPRETLRLVRVGGDVRMITTRTNVDHTDAMRAWAQKRVKAHRAGAARRPCDAPAALRPCVRREGPGRPGVSGASARADAA